MNEKLKWAAVGWISLLAMKYLIVGLDDWNGALHPGIQIAPNQEAFRKPLLGLLG
jgi:hypothetical protein